MTLAVSEASFYFDTLGWFRSYQPVVSESDGSGDEFRSVRSQVKSHHGHPTEVAEKTWCYRRVIPNAEHTLLI